MDWQRAVGMLLRCLLAWVFLLPPFRFPASGVGLCPADEQGGVGAAGDPHVAIACIPPSTSAQHLSSPSPHHPPKLLPISKEVNAFDPRRGPPIAPPFPPSSWGAYVGIAILGIIKITG